jgi:hypothetical protein
MKILHLTLKKKWFDMIASGEKKEEYREVKEYWVRRLISNHFQCAYAKIPTNYATDYNVVLFRNGHNSNSPTVKVELLGISIGDGKPEWGGGKKHFILKLGKIL